MKTSTEINTNNSSLHKKHLENLEEKSDKYHCTEEADSIRNSKNYIDCNRDGMNYNEN